MGLAWGAAEARGSDPSPAEEALAAVGTMRMGGWGECLEAVAAAGKLHPALICDRWSIGKHCTVRVATGFICQGPAVSMPAAKRKEI